MWTFGKKVAAGFGLAFLLLAAIGTVAYRSIDTLTRTSYRAAHSHNVLEHIAGVLSLMKDAETGQRGFVISGDETFLAPYTEAIGSLDKVVRELRELTADNPGQQQRLDQAAPLIADKLFELKRTIAIRRTEGFQATEKVVAEGVGKRYMDDLRRVLAEMERDERGLLKQRADEVEASAAGARTTISELLATSRQIAESAQRVARVATETAAAARTGDDTVQRTHESVAGIKRQVDVIVAHMIELGKKSQQIGSVLEII